MCFLICIYIQNITFSILCDVVAINNMCSAHTSIHSYPGIRFEWTIHTWHNHRDQYLVVTVTLECLSKHKHTLTYTCTCTTTTIPSPSSTIYSFHRLLSIFFFFSFWFSTQLCGCADYMSEHITNFNFNFYLLADASIISA